MKTLIGLTAGLAAIGTGYHLEARAPEAASVPIAGETGRYSLSVTGSATACDVTKGRRLSERTLEITFGTGCTKAYARLAEATIWREDSHGDVAFATRDGKTLVRFASGDGVAYESYRPTVPFISLVAAD